MAKLSIYAQKRPAYRGMTLIEMLIVLVIIGLVTSMVAINLLPLQEKAFIDKARNDIAVIYTAIDQYKLDNRTYPSNIQGLAALIEPPADLADLSRYRPGGYFRKKTLPVDPWGNTYQYLYAEDAYYPVIFSMGADGEPGGKGKNADIYEKQDE